MTRTGVLLLFLGVAGVGVYLLVAWWYRTKVPPR